MAPLNPGWYVVRTSTNAIGLVLHHGTGSIDLGPASNGQVTQAIPVADSSQQMAQVSSSQAVQRALGAIGASAKQIQSFVFQSDTAAGSQQTNGPGLLGILTFGLLGGGASKHQTTQLLFDSSGSPTASSGTQPVSTSSKGDANYTGPTVPTSWEAALTAILTWLTTAKNWVRVLEYIGGAAMIAIAFREMAK